MNVKVNVLWHKSVKFGGNSTTINKIIVDEGFLLHVSLPHNQTFYIEYIIL